MCSELLELSVIVPILNEQGAIPLLFESLGNQRQVYLELILADGGSCDAGPLLATRLARQAPFPVRMVTAPRGRGTQLNCGAAAARAPHLLFLHADSRFPAPLALRSALDRLAEHEAADPELPLAGHFRLEFEFPGEIPLPYRFYAAKARLDRPGCTHGDQGLVMSAGTFARLGPFPETGMEDTLFAERVRTQGVLELLPARILTSPRRFLSEGLLPRQTLNAVLMGLQAVGRLDLLPRPENYRPQGETERLRLERFLLPLRDEIARLTLRERLGFWYRIGSYVRANAWQLPFLLDFLLEWYDDRGGRWLTRHDRWLAPALDGRAGNAVATVLVWCWFRLAVRWNRAQEGGAASKGWCRSGAKKA